MGCDETADDKVHATGEDMSSRGRSGLRRCLGVALASIVVASLSISGAGAAPQLLDTLTVTAGAGVADESSFELVQGQTYKLVLTGTGDYTVVASNGNSSTTYMDAVYVFGSNYAPVNPCEQGCEGTYLEHAIGASPFKRYLPGRYADDGSLKDPPPPPLDGQTHRYEWTFTAWASGRLQFRDHDYEDDTATGSYRIEIYGEPSTTPTPPPACRAQDQVPCPPNYRDVDEPDPGERVKFPSLGPLPDVGGVVKVNATNSAGDHNDNTYVSEGETKKKRSADIVTCMLLGPDSLEVKGGKFSFTEEKDGQSREVEIEIDEYVKERQKKWEGSKFESTIRLCMQFVNDVMYNMISPKNRASSWSRIDGRMQAARAAPRAADSGCHLGHITLDLRIRNGTITKLGLPDAQRLPASAPRYTCTSASPEEMEVTVRHGKSTSLRASLGKKLDLGVIRHPDATRRDATLTLGFENSSGEPGPSPSPSPSPSTSQTPGPSPSPSANPSPSPTPTSSGSPSPSPSSSPSPSGSLEADYTFQNNLDGACGAPTLTTVGTGTGFATETVDGTSRSVFTWPAGSGLSLKPFSNVAADVYTIVMLFRFQETFAYRRILDFKDFTNQNGLYNYSGYIYFYGTQAGDQSVSPIKPNTYVQVVASRNTSGVFKGYVNGTKYMEFNDTGSHGIVANDTLRFFRGPAGDGYDSPGAVARIRIYRTALSDAQVAGLDRLGTGSPAC